MHAHRIAPRAFSIAQFAAAHDLSRSTVYSLIRRGELVTFRVGKRRLVSIEAAEAWRAAREAEAHGRAA